MDAQQHWDHVYQVKQPTEVSWYRPHLDASLALIQRVAPAASTAIIDVGGGESTLVDDLLAAGYSHLTVLDIAATAIERTRSRLGPSAASVQWLVGDITSIALPVRAYDVWHDRAAFHFLTSPEQRSAYVSRVASAVRPGGRVIVGAFGPEGPKQCSGLDVMRYDAPSLHGQFGARFRLIESSTELHETPFGSMQQFLYCYCILD